MPTLVVSMNKTSCIRQVGNYEHQNGTKVDRTVTNSHLFPNKDVRECGNWIVIMLLYAAGLCTHISTTNSLTQSLSSSALSIWSSD